MAAAAVVGWLAVRAGPAAIRVVVEGRQVRVRVGTTLAEAARRYHLRPRAGSLLDVEGQVLRRGVFPGVLLVNGRAASGGRRLRAGDHADGRDGADRVEPRRREVVPTSVERRPSPQFFVDLVPGRSIVISGAVSHKLVSARFVPDGPAVPDRAVALTFDDGPSPYTARILAVLRRLHVPATFFVIGLQAERYPRLARQETEAGMVVGNHSYDHPNRTPFARLPRRRIRSEIVRGQAVLARLGVRSVLFRPPGGSISRYVLRTASEHGLRVVLWSVDARDWVRGTRPRQIVRRVLGNVRAGSIVELHDGGGDRSATLKALPAIVAGIRTQGLRLVALAPTG
jgi:peptidoglycan-N-acetylglucosamine deacetylase